MILSDAAVRRPVLATVARLLLLTFGAISFLQLPLRELPDIDAPVVSIDTRYPGASAAVVESRITQPVEDQISGIEAIKTIDAVSQDGRSSITIEFDIERDIDAAANDLRDAVARVAGDLPLEANPPEIFKANADGSNMVAIVGDPSAAREMIARFVDAGVDELILIMQMGTVPHEVIMRSLKTFAEKVMPHFA